MISKSTTITSGGLTASALSVTEAFSAPSVTNVPISNVPTPGILWGAAATAATNAFMMTEAFLAKAEEVAKAARRVARRSGGDDDGGGPMTYAQIGKAYQASLKAFKEKLMKDGLTEDQASAFKSQAAKNGSIASVAGAALGAVKAEKDANQRMEDKMADIDAADEARWTESQAVIAERGKVTEAEKQKVLDDFRAGEQQVYDVAMPDDAGWLSNLLSSGASALGSVLSPAKNTGGGLLSVSDYEPPEWIQDLIDKGKEIVTATIEKGKELVETGKEVITAVIEIGKKLIETGKYVEKKVIDDTVAYIEDIPIKIALRNNPTAELNLPAGVPPIKSFGQNQRSVPKTGYVECVTTAAVTSRNIMNWILADLANKPPLPDLSVKDAVAQLDSMGDSEWPYRVPSKQPPVPVLDFPIAGWMHPKYQLPNTLDLYASEFQAYYGCSFKHVQTSGNTLDDVAKMLRAGNLVIPHGMFEVTDMSNPQYYFGGAPHTRGAITNINASARTITVLETDGTLNTIPAKEFLAWWGKPSILDTYTKPNTMTILIPDTVCSPINTPTPTPTSLPTSTPTTTSMPIATITSTNTSTPIQTSTPSATPEP